MDGIDRTRSLKTRVEADRLRTQLKEAAVAGLPSDRSTGLPEAWVNHQATWFEWSVTWIGHKWPRWAGNTRRSAVETLVALTPHLTRPGAPPAPADLGDHLRTVAYNPAATEAALPWLERLVDPARSDHASGHRSDAGCGHHPARRPAHVGHRGPAPQEGLAVVRGATTSPGARYTADGETWENKGLKQRAADAVREVPLPPPLVAELRRHLERFPSSAKVFTNVDEKPVSPANYGPVWERARKKLWPGDHLLAATTVYELSHAAATTMLRSGVMAAESARRLGHSVDEAGGFWCLTRQEEIREVSR